MWQAESGEAEHGLVGGQGARAVREERERPVEVRRQGFDEVVGELLVGAVVGGGRAGSRGRGNCTGQISAPPISAGQALNADAPPPEKGKQKIRPVASGAGGRTNHGDAVVVGPGVMASAVPG